MQKFSKSLWLFAGLFTSFALADGTAFADGTLYRDLNLVDVEQSTILPHRDIMVRRGRIVSIKATRSERDDMAKARESAEAVYNLRGHYATPGLIDAHVHPDLYYWNKQADDWSLPLYIANGVTAIRDCAGSPLTLEMRRQVKMGKRLGSHMVIASPFLTSEDVDPGSNAIQVKTAEEATATVKQLLTQGYDSVKVDSGLAIEPYEAAAKTLAERGSYLFGHALFSHDHGYWEVLLDETLAHFRTLEHITWVFSDFLQTSTSPYYHAPSVTNPFDLVMFAPAYTDFSKVPELVQKLRNAHAIVSPTLLVFGQHLNIDIEKDRFLAGGIAAFHSGAISRYLPDYYFQVWSEMYKTWGLGLDNPKRKIAVEGYENSLRLTKLLDDAGISIIAGTDTPARPAMVAGFALHDELDLYRKAGMSGWRTLRTATITAAQALGLAHDVGSIRQGKLCDIVLTRDNPVANIAILRHPAGVVTHGVLHNRAVLDRMLQAVQKQVRTIPTPGGKPSFHADR